VHLLYSTHAPFSEIDTTLHDKVFWSPRCHKNIGPWPQETSMAAMHALLFLNLLRYVDLIIMWSTCQMVILALAAGD
jgi:hypothetical protein